VRWTVHGERTIYSSQYVSLSLVDVEPPGLDRFEHHAVRFGRPVVACLTVDHDDRVLMIHRHRFIVDAWGWELPAGRSEPNETLGEGAARECREETGWRPVRVEHLAGINAGAGILDLRFEIFVGADALLEGPPSDPEEASRIEWIPKAELLPMIEAGEVPAALAQLGILRWLARGYPAAMNRQGRSTALEMPIRGVAVIVQPSGRFPGASRTGGEVSSAPSWSPVIASA
jgi:8-oxo-dGTP pyrophosphatase MutT (NUDIX family)